MATIGHFDTTSADAVAPHHDGAGGHCLNCGAVRVGDFCHDCGQCGHVHRTMGAIGHELAHGVFHFEGKIWRTLPMLLFHPGALTRRYIDGERARFVSPLALFLFIVFVLFAMLSVVGAHLELPELEEKEARSARVKIEQSIARNGEQIASLTAERARATTPAARDAIDARIAERQRETAATQTVLATMEPGKLSGLEKVRTGWKRLDKGLAKAAENPNLMLYKLQSNAYKFAWVLIPLSLPFMWLLFPFSRRFTMYDHAIFVTYSLCFVSLVGVVLSLVGMSGIATGLLMTCASIVIPIHMYKQLRGTYLIGRVGAALRMVLMFIAANVALAGFVTLLMGLGLVG
ncbi:DUF3667 domain-containing protein [Sphingomonas mollis]|uniref:DUF3667 domain-containing protein n=1 Tax=Sphingomonas mollis TaxID=2795726 RepID=A0ABS0XNP7_9SPHN|nr:DUF3667 domain-containing protein [Sphingomonas sp. BT553]MBJ6121410.1 DUF3667 domain-containing protein [Sphingomonas sp. BT553]